MRVVIRNATAKLFKPERKKRQNMTPIGALTNTLN